MKTKLVLWAAQPADETTEKVLVALELKPEDNKICSWVIFGEAATEDLEKQLREDWKKDSPVAFPESHKYGESELSATGNLLPDGVLATEHDELIKRTQTEWLFVVLSTKLYKDYLSQVDDLRQRVESLSKYDKAVWGELKEFWDKVQNHIKEQNLSKDHTGALRDRVNGLFDAMKQLRQSEDEAFEREAKGNYDKILAEVERIETTAATAEGGELSKLFDALKNLQREYHNTRLTRDLRSKLWDKIDAAFKVVKERRFPNSSNNSSNANNNQNAANGGGENRLQRRIDGLHSAIQKMQESIDRDEKEWEFQSKKINSGNASQLETQLREVRGKLIQERIDSKRTKLDDMKRTLGDLEEKNARRAERIKKGEAPAPEDTEDELTSVELENNTTPPATTTEETAPVIEENDNTKDA